MTMPPARIALYCDLAARAIIDGLSESQVAAGVDVGASRRRCRI